MEKLYLMKINFSKIQLEEMMQKMVLLQVLNPSSQDHRAQIRQFQGQLAIKDLGAIKGQVAIKDQVVTKENFNSHQLEELR